MALITAKEACALRPPPPKPATHAEHMAQIDAIIREVAPNGTWARIPGDLLPGYGIWSWAQGNPPPEAQAIEAELTAAGYTFFLDPGGDCHSPYVSVVWGD
jgi:hypothetical protein